MDKKTTKNLKVAVGLVGIVCVGVGGFIIASTTLPIAPYAGAGIPFDCQNIS